MAERSGGFGIAVAGLSLGAGLVAGSWLLGAALVDAQAAARTVTVKGLSERIVMADTANWRVPFRALGKTQLEALAGAVRARDAIFELGRDGGLAPETMSVEPFMVSIERDYIRAPDGGQIERLRYVAKGAVRMRSNQPDQIEALTQRTVELLDQGVFLGSDDYGGVSSAIYSFTGLNEIKPDMIAEATKNARAAASQFAEDSGSAVGRILNARQGAVQITAADGDYAESAEQRKIVRLVSTVDYELVD